MLKQMKGKKADNPDLASVAVDPRQAIELRGWRVPLGDQAEAP